MLKPWDLRGLVYRESSTLATLLREESVNGLVLKSRDRWQIRLLVWLGLL